MSSKAIAKNLMRAGAVAGALLAASPSAHAAIVHAAATIDLNSIAPGTPDNFTVSLDAPVAVNAGDSIVFDATFLSGQKLLWKSTGGGASASFSLLTSLAYAFSADISNVSVNFFDFSTDGSLANPAAGFPFIGVGPDGIPAIVGDLGLAAGQFMSFTGFEVTFDVTAVSPVSGSLAPPILFDSAWIVADGVQASIVEAPSAVPVPAALPLFAGGAGLIGLLARRRKRRRRRSLPDRQ